MLLAWGDLDIQVGVTTREFESFPDLPVIAETRGMEDRGVPDRQIGSVEIVGIDDFLAGK
ncbi:MAG: hypothetical protein GY910_01490 [bacterium]|nr:hypothetical protein [bacterium]